MNNDETQFYSNPSGAWQTCERADWMLSVLRGKISKADAGQLADWCTEKAGEFAAAEDQMSTSYAAYAAKVATAAGPSADSAEYKFLKAYPAYLRLNHDYTAYLAASAESAAGYDEINAAASEWIAKVDAQNAFFAFQREMAAYIRQVIPAFPDVTP
jgi:hypothetical protein